MQNSRSIKRKTENINIILKAEKENKSEKKNNINMKRKASVKTIWPTTKCTLPQSSSVVLLYSFFVVFRQVTILLHRSLCVSLCRGNHFWLAAVSNLYERVRHSMTLINNFLLLMLVELCQCWSYIKERQCTCLKSTTTFSAIEQLRNER